MQFATMEGMSEVLHANIFFFITGIAVIVFTLLLCVALVHIIRLIKSVRRIVARIEQGTEVLSEDMQNFRTHMSGGGVVRKFLHFLFGSSKVTETEDENEEEEPIMKSKGNDKKRTALKIKDES